MSDFKEKHEAITSEAINVAQDIFIKFGTLNEEEMAYFYLHFVIEMEGLDDDKYYRKDVLKEKGII